MTMRTKEGQAKYDAFRKEGGLEGGCRLCEAPAIKTFTHWKVIENLFPYDLVATTHHMIVPVRHASEPEITPEEWREWGSLKHQDVGPDYEYLIEATHRVKTIPGHFHIHLLVTKN